MSESTLAVSLLQAPHAEREALLRSAETEELAAAVERLAHMPDHRSAEVLVLIDETVGDRSLRKAARRGLHRLQSMGVEPPARGTASAPRVDDRQPKALPITEAWASDIDPSGSRALWLLADRPLGGIWFAPLLLNDQTGLEDVNLVETTRKRYQRDIEPVRPEATTWVSLPGDYGLRLVREAADLTREVGGALPTRYHGFRDVFGEAQSGPERALVYQSISLVEINFNPGWLDDSTRLLGEREVGGWYVTLPDELRGRALDVARAPTAGLLVPGHTPEQQASQLIADAARQAVTPNVRRAFRRRLEETAYLFVATERLILARLAAASAQALAEGGPPPERHPLMRLFVAAGLARLVSGETVFGRRASEALLELIERATSAEDQAGAVETRPSGLILPR